MPAPDIMTFDSGAAVAHGKIAYFSTGNTVYSYSPPPEEKWTSLTPCEYSWFSLVVVNGTLTTVGGWKDYTTTNALCSSSSGGILGIILGMKWKKLLPPMTTGRIRPAAVTTPNHLVVAGGRTGVKHGPLSSVEVLDLTSSQWSSADHLPQALGFPHAALCAGHLYLSQGNTVFSCSVELLLANPSASSVGDSVWISSKPAAIPTEGAIVALGENLLSVGGKDSHGTPKRNIHCYNSRTNSWSIIGAMSISLYDTLVAVLLGSELIVVGGRESHNIYSTVTYTGCIC